MKRRIGLFVWTVCMMAAVSGCGSAKTAQSEAASTEGGSAEAAVATADENGNYLVNGSFEEVDFTGWNVTNVDDVTEELDIYTRDTDCYEGVQSLHFYSGSHDVNFTAEQTVTGLEAGSYKMTAHIQGDAAGDENASVYFYAVVGGETIKADASLDGYVNWYTAELTGLSVSDGEVTVGVSVTTAPGGWGTIDDITLVKGVVMQFIKGMDVSMLKELERRGAAYYLAEEQEDLFAILHKCGVNMIRLRIWQDPYDEKGESYGGGGNDLPTTIELAKRTVLAGMSFLLDFHYSDFWADPAKQVKPKSWRNLQGSDLETAVYLHTVNTLKAMKNEKLVPAMIQIGNEITNGMLWPDGHADNTETLAALLQAGLRGAREVCPDAGLMLHLDFGTDNAAYRNWFDRLAPYRLDFDVIGMSYYPHWNGSMALLCDNMNDVSSRYDKDVIIAETSIGYTTDVLGCRGIVFSKEQEKATGYPATPEGQETFLRDLYAAVRGVGGGRGVGVFYWEPAWLPIPDCKWANENGCAYMNDRAEAGNTMANQALFDASGRANRALLHLREM